MKFSTQTEVQASAGKAFAGFSDFAAFARRARHRGVEIERTDHGHVVGRGLAWHARFDWNGRAREMRGEIVHFDPPSGYEADLSVAGLDGRLEVEVTALSDTKSRVRIGLELRPTTMSARILLKSLQLAKGRLDERFFSTVRSYAEGIGEGD